MDEPQYLDTPAGRRIAYHHSAGKGPGVVFLGGFKSDMEGTKAIHLQQWARGNGRAFLRLDYSGHGKSSGTFEEGCIGDWAADAMAAIDSLTQGPQILVGSSMGGWIALLAARAMPDRVAGMVGIAAAPDFTEDGMWAGFDATQREEITVKGRLQLPSDYSDEPYVITDRLIADGREHLVLRAPLELPFPVRLLQGTEDEDVSREVALRLLDHVDCPDIHLTLVKGADHRFSTPGCLALVERGIEAVTARAGTGG